jgi:hypothetical protein
MVILPDDEIEFLNSMADQLTGNAMNSAAWISIIPTWSTANQIIFLANELRYLRQCLMQFEIPCPGLTSVSFLYNPGDLSTLKKLGIAIASSLSQPRSHPDRRRWLNDCCIGATHLRGTLCVIKACAPRAIAFAEKRNAPINGTAIAVVAAVDFQAPRIDQVDSAITLCDRLVAIAKIEPLSSDSATTYNDGNRVSDKDTNTERTNNANSEIVDSAPFYKTLILILDGAVGIGLWEIAGVLLNHGYVFLSDLATYFSLCAYPPSICLVAQKGVPKWTKNTTVVCLVFWAGISAVFLCIYGVHMATVSSVLKSRFAVPTILSIVTAAAWYFALRTPQVVPPFASTTTAPSEAAPEYTSHSVLIVTGSSPTMMMPSLAPIAAKSPSATTKSNSATSPSSTKPTASP